MEIIKQLSKTLVKVILVTLLSYNLYNFYCIKVLKHDLATVNGYGILEVITGSMEPTIHVGDLIVIDTETKDYQVNDIVTFYDVDGSFVTHRIMAINEDKVVTKGDNNNTNDEEMAKSKIVGKYVTKMTGLGKVLSSLKSPIVMVVVMLIGIMVCMFISIDKDKNQIDVEDKSEFLRFKEEKEKNKR